MLMIDLMVPSMGSLLFISQSRTPTTSSVMMTLISIVIPCALLATEPAARQSRQINLFDSEKANLRQ
jgi:hypothetical protein